MMARLAPQFTLPPNGATSPFHRRGAAIVRVLLGAMFMAVPAIGVASNLNFLRNSPISYFDREDMDLMRANAGMVLDDTTPRAKRAWRNPKTGHSGDAEVKSTFISTDGSNCKRLRIANNAKTVSGETVYSVCWREKRGWEVTPKAVPDQTRTKEEQEKTGKEAIKDRP